MMPFQSGAPVINACREKQIPVVVITGLTYDLAREIVAPGIVIASKPFDFREMDDVLNRLLGQALSLGH